MKQNIFVSIVIIGLSLFGASIFAPQPTIKEFIIAFILFALFFSGMLAPAFKTKSGRNLFHDNYTKNKW
jgi:hypothetical protein